MTMTRFQRAGLPRVRAARAVLGAAMLSGLVVSCKASDIDITNPNIASPTGAAADPTAFQLFATGMMADQRGTRSAFITTVGIMGREAYTFNPQEGRSITHPLLGVVIGGVQQLDPSSQFSVPGAGWTTQYGVLRDVFNFKNAIPVNLSLSTAGKAAALGFVQTFEALMLLEVIQTRDSLGGVVEILADPSGVAPFVTRDSMYKYILNTLDAGATNLAAGGATFPFTMAPGYAGFTTPATFAQFNRAIKARAAANYATAGGGSAAWQATLTGLSASFLNGGAANRAALDVGVYDTFSASPDTPNSLTQATNTALYAHPSILTDAQLKANGSVDDRYTAKIRTGLPLRTGPSTTDGPTTGSSSLGFSIWPTVSSSVPVIRNEELILLRAEARLATGDKAGAIADLNVVRTVSGGLPPTTLTTGSSDDAVLTGILYEKRYSLLMEGDRWIDMRRYNKLNLLPLDIASGPNKNFVAKVIPIPQAECQVRAKLAAQFLGPAGLNDCK
jgi:hypothetical protein